MASSCYPTLNMGNSRKMNESLGEHLISSATCEPETLPTSLSPSCFSIPTPWVQLRSSVLELVPLAVATFSVYRTQSVAFAVYLDDHPNDPTGLTAALFFGVFLPPLMMMIMTLSLAVNIFYKRAAYYWMLKNASVVIGFSERTYMGAPVFRWNAVGFVISTAVMFRCFPNMIHSPSFEGWQNFGLLIFSYGAFFTLSMDFFYFEKKLVTITDGYRCEAPGWSNRLVFVTEEEAHCVFLEVDALTPSKKQDREGYDAYELSPGSMLQLFVRFLHQCRSDPQHQHKRVPAQDSKRHGRRFHESCGTRCARKCLGHSSYWSESVWLPKNTSRYFVLVNRMGLALFIAFGVVAIAIELYGGWTVFKSL
mmetsp:Transcript_27757/g.54656  ORF Transcript_27757/g.54656 Transcript_27757/m.54656 type:complete len:365 (-) Transcript_27757:314-1408(-)